MLAKMLAVVVVTPTNLPLAAFDPVETVAPFPSSHLLVKLLVDPLNETDNDPREAALMLIFRQRSLNVAGMAVKSIVETPPEPTV